MLQPIIVAAIITFVVLAVGAAMSPIGPWYRELPKPDWTPPNWLFGPAWTVIGALTAWAGVLAWVSVPDPAAHARIAFLFAVNVVFHILWSPLFFKLQRPDWALIEVPFLWLSVFALVVGLAPSSMAASWLLLPYLVWVAFAGYLNFAIVRMNAPFGARHASRLA